MTSMSFDEFVTRVFDTDGLGPMTIAYPGIATVVYQTDQGPLKSGRSVWCFLERDAAGQWAVDHDRTEDLYLMARWVASGWGRNTTGEGRLQTEPEKDLVALVCGLLDNVCPVVTWTQAGKLFQEITAGTLAEQGKYEETVGDGVLEEYEFIYAYKVVRLRSLYHWLDENGLLDTAVQ